MSQAIPVKRLLVRAAEYFLSGLKFYISSFTNTAVLYGGLFCFQLTRSAAYESGPTRSLFAFVLKRLKRKFPSPRPDSWLPSPQYSGEKGRG